MSHRTFIALDLDDAARRRLTSMRDAIRLAAQPSRQGGRGEKISWVAPENFHVTLKFLGDVSDAQLVDVCGAVQAVSDRTEPFDFTVGAVHAIPPQGRDLRMFWAEVEDSASRLPALFDSLEQAIQPLGFPRENRPFASHITLARVKFTRHADALRAAADSLAETSAGQVHADYVTVYTSELAPGGSIYTPACRAELGGKLR